MTADPEAFADCHAVLVGVSAYEDAGFRPIRAARNSAEAMRELLTDPALCGWPPERVKVILNPLSAVDLATRIADLAENTTGVFLLYFVGHGVLSARAELCLALTSTRMNRPKISGLAWDVLAEVLHTSPARVRLAILDCCFAGQAIEALAADSGPSLADLTHVEGVYTLTATTRNRTAHVPPPDQQDLACTSFTGELRDLIRAGIQDRPARLTLGDIYPVLRQRLRAKGLPTPNQRGTDTVHQFPFTANPANPADTVIKADSWYSSRTDQTPFTANALLCQQFTTDTGVGFTRLTGGAKPCDQAASGPGPMDSGEMVDVLANNGCAQVMAALYVEQRGSDEPADNPVLVSVTVFACTDNAAAEAVYGYIKSGAMWNLTMWCTQPEGGSWPCTSSNDHGYRHASYRYHHRYVFAAVAHRADLATSGSLHPLLLSAAQGASHSCGPGNHGTVVW